MSAYARHTPRTSRVARRQTLQAGLHSWQWIVLPEVRRPLRVPQAARANGVRRVVLASWTSDLPVLICSTSLDDGLTMLLADERVPGEVSSC